MKKGGTTEKFIAPYSLDSQIGEPVTIATVVPTGITDATFLCMRTGRSFDAYVEGECIFSFDTSNRKAVKHIVKGVYVPIPLSAMVISVYRDFGV